MKQGDKIYTPRFCTVTIADVLGREAARDQGFKEPTNYDNPDFDIYGKHTGPHRMIFAAVEKN